MIKLKLTIVASLFMLGSVFAKGESAAAACPTISMSGSNVNCNGATNGQASVSIANGSGNYTITWSNLATSSTINGLAVGTYTVNVKDNISGCTVVGAFVVGSPDPISVSGIVSNVGCFGESTGGVLLNVIGGNGGYSFDWQNSSNVSVQSSQNLTNQSAGNYTVYVTDSKTCTFSQTFTITQPIEELQSSYLTQDSDCNGSATGSIDANIWGGTLPYGYSWDSGPLTQDLSNINAGTYVLSVIDGKGCTLSLSATIAEPDILGGAISSTPVFCYGESTGSVGFNPTGGTAPYTYAWRNATTLYSTSSNVLTGLPAGTYFVTVTDANGCEYITSTDVTQPSELIGSTVVTNVLCFGDFTGAIDLSIGGGTNPYLYNWENDLGTTIFTGQSLANVGAGSYSVTVTDGNLCSFTINDIITQPLLPVSSVTIASEVLCYGGSTGAIDLILSGGTPLFTYTWTSGQITEDISGLVAGNYAYIATDANGCTNGGSVTITQPAAPLSVTNVITDVVCFGESNGSIDLTVSGGTTPYSYAWANGLYVLSEVGQDLNDFVAESYNYTITDDNGCTILDTLVINEPPVLEITLVGTDILCKGGNNGAIDLTVVGGVTSYFYLWSNSSLTEDQTLLTAGTYGVLVTDANLCTITDTITLTEPLDSLRYTFEVSDVLCNDGTDGELDINVTGGTIPYNYDWSNGDTTSFANNLTAGYYTFTVVDNNACVLTDSLFVDQPEAVTLSEVITPASCFEDTNGIIDISPLGGTTPYSFTWFNSDFALSAQTEDLVDFPADTYQLEIIDSNGCFYEMFLQIEQPEVIEITYTFERVSCKEGQDGSIDVTVTGGNTGSNYLWSNGATTEDLVNIPSDIYELVYSDSKGCTESVEVDILEPDSIRISFEFTEISCNDQSDGIAIAYPEGGNGGYTYLWSTPETSNTNTELSNEWYSVTITDILGCTGMDSVFITMNSDDCVFPVNTFSPNGDAYNDTWVIDNIELYPEMKMQVFNKWGNLVHIQEGIYTPWDGSSKGVQLPSETYYYILLLNQENRDPLTGNITIVR